MRTFVDRVNSCWKTELATLKLEQRVQFIDMTEYVRLFVLENCRGEFGQSKDDDDKSILQSWLEGGDDDVYRYELLCGKIQCLADRYPVTEKGTVVVKVHDGFDYDSYIAEKLWQTTGRSLVLFELLKCGLQFWGNRRVVFVDSVLSELVLGAYSRSIRSIRLIRTTVHSISICQHLVQPLYVAHHFAIINQQRSDTIWAQLLDTYGQLSVMESLVLLKQLMVKKHKQDEHSFNETVATLYMTG